MRPIGRAVLILALVTIVVVATACAGMLFNKPGTITVTNTGLTESAVIGILAEDAKSYRTLAPGQSAVITTELGGSYQVVVIMAAVDVQDYQNNLQVLKHNVQAVVDGTASNDEKVLFFTYLAGINSQIAQAHASGGASCTGKIEVSEDEATSVDATVAWTTTLGSGFWAMTCGST